MALVRADAKIVYFNKRDKGAGVFRRTPNRSWGNQPSLDLILPEGTFPNWERTEPAPGHDWTTIKDEEIETNVPFIPAHITIPGKLENYYILFEVSQWKRTAKVKDPYLLQRVNENTFIVLNEWDVTDVEAIVMRGAA